MKLLSPSKRSSIIRYLCNSQRGHNFWYLCEMKKVTLFTKNVKSNWPFLRSIVQILREAMCNKIYIIFWRNFTPQAHAPVGLRKIHIFTIFPNFVQKYQITCLFSSEICFPLDELQFWACVSDKGFENARFLDKSLWHLVLGAKIWNP